MDNDNKSFLFYSILFYSILFYSITVKNFICNTAMKNREINSIEQKHKHMVKY